MISFICLKVKKSYRCFKSGFHFPWSLSISSLLPLLSISFLLMKIDGTRHWKNWIDGTRRRQDLNPRPPNRIHDKLDHRTTVPCQLQGIVSFLVSNFAACSSRAFIRQNHPLLRVGVHFKFFISKFFISSCFLWLYSVQFNRLFSLELLDALGITLK